MNTRIVVLLAGALLVTSMVPVAQASHQQVKVPPHQTGEGNNDVEDELGGGHPKDRVEPTNGFPATPFDEPKLVLEAFYETNYWQVDVDYNNVFRELVAQSGTATWQDVIYPGLGYFNAWWGWWWDKGGGHQLNDADLGPASGAGTSAQPNHAIDDAHDDPDNWDGDPNHGSWDEFLWRGDNKFAPEHPFAKKSIYNPVGQSRFPGDSMKLFFSPGSKYTAPFFGDFDDAGPTTAPRPGLLLDEKDDPREPEWSYSDRTSYGAYAVGAGPSGVPQFGGWVSENGWMHFQYDTSLLMSARATSSVNPEPAGGGLFHPHDKGTTATDVDVYAAAHPQIEDLYRTAVWDPGDEEDSPGDETIHEDGEGIKQRLKEEFTTRSTTLYAEVDSAYNELVAPVREAQGAADDNAGFRPRAHEPNSHGDDFNGHATFDPDTAYGGVNAETYYRPGGKAWDPSSPNTGTQTYEGYAKENLWLDMQAGFGAPVLTPLFSVEGNYNLHPAPNTGGDAGNQADDSTAAPSLMWFTGNLGLWHDYTGDTFVGDLSEAARSVSPEHPYNQGNVDDPNDYGDNINTQRDDASPPEWEGVDSATVSMTVEPLTPNKRWGTTGVYVYSDAQGQFNPYDDVVADTTGGVVFSDDDNFDGSDGQFSRHVQKGEIDLAASFNSQDGAQGATGSWVGDQYLLLPEGSSSYAIKLTTKAKIRKKLVLDDGRVLDPGTTIKDVDVIESWT